MELAVNDNTPSSYMNDQTLPEQLTQSGWPAGIAGVVLIFVGPIVGVIKLTRR